MGSGWQVQEFGTHHEGRAVAVLADGTEPKPAIFDSGSGPGMHQTSDWWVYDGTLNTPRATGVRAGCSCGWRGTTTYSIDWNDLSERPYDAETPGPREDWAAHTRQVEDRTVPLPDDLADLLARLDERLAVLADDAPVAALRAVAALERTAATARSIAACNIESDETPWDVVGRQLGLSEAEARRKVRGYRYAG